MLTNVVLVTLLKKTTGRARSVAASVKVRFAVPPPVPTLPSQTRPPAVFITNLYCTVLSVVPATSKVPVQMSALVEVGASGEAEVLQELMASPAITTVSEAGLKLPKAVWADMLTWKVTWAESAVVVERTIQPRPIRKPAEVFMVFDSASNWRIMAQCLRMSRGEPSPPPIWV